MLKLKIVFIKKRKKELYSSKDALKKVKASYKLGVNLQKIIYNKHPKIPKNHKKKDTKKSGQKI